MKNFQTQNGAGKQWSSVPLRQTKQLPNNFLTLDPIDEGGLTMRIFPR